MDSQVQLLISAGASVLLLVLYLMRRRARKMKEFKGK